MREEERACTHQERQSRPMLLEEENRSLNQVHRLKLSESSVDNSERSYSKGRRKVLGRHKPDSPKLPKSTLLSNERDDRSCTLAASHSDETSEPVDESLPSQKAILGVSRETKKYPKRSRTSVESSKLKRRQKNNDTNKQLPISKSRSVVEIR